MNASKFSIWICLALVIPLQAWSAKGRVIDEETGQPIAGAFVYAIWRGKAFNPIDSSTRCYHFEVTRSDANGEFDLPEFSGSLVAPMLSNRVRHVNAYAPGYDRSLKPKRVDSPTIPLKAFKGTPSQRIQGIGYVSFLDCLPEDRWKVLFDIYSAVAKEISEIAVTPEEKRTAGSYRRRAADTLLSPHERAQRDSKPSPS